MEADAGSVHDYAKPDVLAAIRAQRARTVALLQGLPEPEWERIVLPGWRVREVAAHLVSTDEAALTGRMMLLGLRTRPVADVEAWNETQIGRWADRDVPDIIAGLERWGRRMTRTLALAPGVISRRRIPTPLGKVSLLWLGMARVFDEWVHMEDVRRTFGFPADDSREVVAPVARHLQAGIPVQTLSRIPSGASGRVTLGFEGLDLPAVGLDLGERRYGYSLAGKGTLIAGRPSSLVMVAAGRDRWREEEAAGRIRIEGEREPAETMLDALLVV